MTSVAHEALALVDELLAARRISTVEARLLRGLKGESQSEWLLPQGFERDDLVAWAEALCAQLQTSPTALCQRAGLSPSTLNRFLNKADHDYSLSSTTINLLIGAAKALIAERAA